MLNYIFLQYLKMTKRFGNFADNTAKKIKTNLDDLWGDDLDLDDKDVDDVLLLASQVYEQVGINDFPLSTRLVFNDDFTASIYFFIVVKDRK